MELNYTTKLASVTINGLKLSQSSPSYSVTQQSVQFTLSDKGEIVLNVPSFTAASGNVTVSDFKMNFRLRYMGINAIPVINMTYTVNGIYKVRTVQMSTFYFGDTETTIIGTESVFHTDATYYCVTFDPSVKKDDKIQARLFMYDAKFAPKMPEMNLMLLDLYADMDLTGYHVETESTKVYTGVVQNPKEEPDYAVTNLTMDGVFATGVDFDYTAAGRFMSKASCGYDFTEGVLK